jgi:hypothetical protein
MDVVEAVWRTAGEIVAFVAHLIGAVLGIIALYALYGLIFHRKEVKAFLTLLAMSHLHERIKRVKETLGKLEFLNYDTKEDRQEIFALLGQLGGQTKPLVSECPGLDVVHIEMAGILQKQVKLSEATKRRILYELHGALDSQALAASASLLGNRK